MSRLPALLFLLLAAPQAAEWQTVPVPGARKTRDEVGWYRAWVKGEDGFFSKHERNLFEESVGINILFTLTT